MKRVLICLSAALLAAALPLCGCGVARPGREVMARSAASLPEASSAGAEESASAPRPQQSSAAAAESAAQASSRAEPAQPAPAKPSADESDSPAAARARVVLDNMTQEEKVGQLFLIRPEALDPDLTPQQVHHTTDYGVTALDDRMRDTLARYQVGGIVLFGKNVADPDQLTALTADLQAASKLPLLMGVDEEGGQVARIANSANFQVTRYKSMEAVGATGDPKKAWAVGSTIGAYLRQYGFNLDFAPVADLNTNPQNRVIGNRAFGSNPQLAAKMVVAELKGLHQAGVAGCVKHFPGHGDTKGDTHQGAVTVTKTWEQLQQAELIPFEAALPTTDLVMVAHITTPNITDDGLPASLSRQMIQGRLRDGLGYQGVVVTDSLAMGAIADNYTSGEAAVRALNAGADLLLMPRDFAAAYQGVWNALRDGTVSQQRLDASVLRILTLKARLGLL